MCWECGAAGHLSRDCPSPGRVPGRGRRGPRSQRDAGPETAGVSNPRGVRSGERYLVGPQRKPVGDDGRRPQSRTSRTDSQSTVERLVARGAGDPDPRVVRRIAAHGLEGDRPKKSERDIARYGTREGCPGRGRR